MVEAGTPLERLQLLLGNRTEEIRRASESFNGMAGRHSMPDATRRRVNTVLDELLTNVISYAWEDGGHHEMQLDIELYTDRLVVTVTDDGRPFNPLSKKSPDIAAGVEDRAIGGLGIHLVKGVMDDVSYRRDGDRNVLTLVKRLGGDE